MQLWSPIHVLHEHLLQTRRTRTAGKVDIPSVDDHVSKLEHMGRETVKKLSDIMDAAHQAGIEDLQIHGGSSRKLCIETVGAFQQLALAAENVRQIATFSGYKNCIVHALWLWTGKLSLCCCCGTVT